MFIPDPDLDIFYPSRIPDPGVKQATGSRFRIHSTASMFTLKYPILSVAHAKLICLKQAHPVCVRRVTRLTLSSTSRLSWRILTRPTTTTPRSATLTPETSWSSSGRMFIFRYILYYFITTVFCHFVRILGNVLMEPNFLFGDNISKCFDIKTIISSHCQTLFTFCNNFFLCLNAHLYLCKSISRTSILESLKLVIQIRI